MLVPFLATLANPPTLSAKATICAFAKRVVHSGAISSMFCKMSPTRCGQFDMSFGSENTRSKSPPFSKTRHLQSSTFLNWKCNLKIPTVYLEAPRNRNFVRFRGRHGGVEKGGGWKTSRMTSLPKRGFGPPLVRYIFHPAQASALCFSYTKIHDRADQKLFWRGPKIFGRARSLVRFPPPIRFAPPHITAQTLPLFYTLPPLEGYFQGWGWRGVSNLST